MLAVLRPDRKIRLPIIAALLLLACDKNKRKKPSTEDSGPTHDAGPGPDSDPGCDTGYLEDDGECVPAACGIGTWGNLEVGEGTVYVDIAAAGGGDGSEAAPFASIQEGLDAAGDADGGLVAVAAGTYPETLELGRGHDGVHLAGRCKELVTIDASVGDEATPGIWIDANSSAVEVSNATIRGSPYAGLLVGSGSVVMRDSRVVENGYIGVGAGQTGLHETSLELESCDLTGNMRLGVLAAESGTTVTLRGTTIQDTKPDETGDGGYGVEAYDGATLTMEACEVTGNTSMGVLAHDSGTTVSLQGTTIQETLPGENGESGYGILADDGASLTTEACSVTENTRLGIVAQGSSTTVTLLETTIQDTQRNGNGEFGYGIQVNDGATLSAEACEVAGNSGLGIIASDSGTTVVLAETTIKDTQPTETGENGIGVDVCEGATLTAEACEVVGNAATGLRALDSGTTVTLLETNIQDTHPDPNQAGYGIKVKEGASLRAEACSVAGNTAVGVLVADTDTAVTLLDTTIQDTRPEDDGRLGIGIDIYDGAFLSAEACVLTGNATGGVLAFGSGTRVDLVETTIQDNQLSEGGDAGYGIQIQSGATLAAEACEVAGIAGVGLGATDSGTMVTLLETTIRDTCPDESGQYGYGIDVFCGATLSAQTCTVTGSTRAGILAIDSGTTVTLLESTIQDTLPEDSGDGGYGIAVGYGATLGTEACVVTGNTAVGVLAGEPGTSVTLDDTRVTSTRSAELYTVGAGISGQTGAAITVSNTEISSNEGPAIYITEEDTLLSCWACELQDNQFAGAVVVAGASFALEDSSIGGTSAAENLGGGVGLYSDPWTGAPPTLSVTGTTIQGNPIAGVWLSGEGSYSLSGNAIHGGEGWVRQGLTKCGDAVHVRDGVSSWDGSSGLLLEGNMLADGLGAGLFLDNASATLSGNSYADNAVDLVTQGADCSTPPDGHDGEAFSSDVELCPTYDYATCRDEFALVLTLAEPESGHGGAFSGPGLPGPGAPHLPALAVPHLHTFESLPLLPPAPRIEPLEVRPQLVRVERTPIILFEPGWRG